MFSTHEETPINESEATSALPEEEQAQFFDFGDLFDDPEPEPSPAEDDQHKTESILDLDPSKPADAYIIGLNKRRRSGRTGPTTNLGKAIASRNATKHGMCSKTLILENESEEDWQELLNAWLTDYSQPAEGTVLYTFVHKTAASEWFRMRAQREYEFFFCHQADLPMFQWHIDQIKSHDLVMRYKTAAERAFQRDYRLLEHHYKTHPPATKAQESKPPKPSAAKKEPIGEYIPPKILFTNNETGESMDAQGNRYPPPPGYVPIPIVPGKYPPDHPSHCPVTKEQRALWKRNQQNK
jgi:hypothetical protein